MKMYLRLLKEFWHVKKLFFPAVSFMLLFIFVHQFAPFVLKELIDEVLLPVSQKAQNLEMHLVYEKALQYFFLIFLAFGLGLVAYTLLRFSNTELMVYFQRKQFETMQNLPLSYFDDKPAGQISTRIVNYTTTLSEQFYHVFSHQILSVIVEILISFGFLLYLNYKIALGVVVLAPFLYLWQKMYAKVNKQPIETYYAKESEMNSIFHETMQGAQVIQNYQYEEVWKDNFQKIYTQMQKADLDLVKIQTFLNWSLSDMLKRWFSVLVLSLLAWQFLKKDARVTAGFVFLCMTYVEKIFESLSQIIRTLPNLQHALATGEKVYELMDALQESDGTEDLHLSEGHVRFEEVEFSYVEGTPVLKNLSFEAQAGKTLALVGHTGSGKSSIMNLLFRFYDVQKGKIYIDGQDIALCKRESLRSTMGIVLQDPYLFQGTIASNIRMGNEKLSDAEVEAYLRQVGGGFLLERYPEGIYKEVKEKGQGFSSGEKQLITFARTLAKDPRILVLDEATSHIDTETEEIIQYALRVLTKGRTSFVIAHRLSTVQQADKICVLQEGVLVEEGTHQSLLEKQGIYAKLYDAQSEHLG